MFKFKKRFLTYFAITGVFILFLLFLSPPLRNTCLNTLRHPLSILALLKRETLGLIFFHHNLTENERLNKEMDSLRAKLVSLNEVYLENSRLKNLLSLKQQSAYRVIAARVIARSSDSWSSVVIINKGSSQGIKRGMPVITYLGLAGRVSETTAGTSKIMLINDPGLGVSCVVQRSRQEGLVSGTLGHFLIMKYLPEESDIMPSDAIITSGLTAAYPKGLLIGEVIDINKDLSGLSRYAIIKPAVNLSNIEEVLVILE